MKTIFNHLYRKGYSNNTIAIKLNTTVAELKKFKQQLYSNSIDRRCKELKRLNKVRKEANSTR